MAYPNGTIALRDVDLSVFDRELVALVGPSGGGKSSLLRVVAGLERPSSGVVEIDGVDVTALPPSEREVGMIFQDRALITTLSAAGNIGFPLAVRHVGRATRMEKVEAQGRRVGLSNLLLKRHPQKLSAGHQQLVAAGRALVRHPRVLLADEPLAHLDADLRHRVRTELVRLHREEGTATLYATNDPADAMAVADRLAVMRDGRVVQVGPPLHVYRQPVDLFVAQFLGNAPMSTIPAVMAGSNQEPVLITAGGELSLDRYSPLPAGTDVVVGIRPETLTLADDATSEGRRLRGRVDRLEDFGSYALAIVWCGDAVVRAKVSAVDLLSPGSDVVLAVTEPTHLRLFDPTSGRSLD